MQRYERYKDSGIEWLGEIPSHWRLVPNKYIFEQKKDLVGKKSRLYQLLSLTLNGIIVRNMENPQGKFPAEFDTYQEVNIGDFVFCHFDVEETPRTVGLSNYKGMITGAYTVYKQISKNDSKFLYYWFLNLDLKKRLKPLYKGLRNTISKEAFGSFYSFIPPVEEQSAIARFLDEKCEQIDRAVAQKERVIELLNERRQIVIQRAVTRGLNPDVPLRDSGIDWIGQIPAHWQVKKLKYCVQINNGQDYKPVISESGVPVFGSGGQFAFANRHVYDGEVVLLGRKGTIDKPMYFVGKFWAVDTVFYAIIRQNYCGKFIYYVTKTIPYTYYSTSTALPSMTQTDLNNNEMVLPPLAEQEEIAVYLDTVNQKIDRAVALKREEIEKLKEYKQTLINSAVTGKIKIA